MQPGVARNRVKVKAAVTYGLQGDLGVCVALPVASIRGEETMMVP